MWLSKLAPLVLLAACGYSPALAPGGSGDALRGRIWRSVLSKAELPRLEREHAVISTKLLSGRTLARVYSEADPGPGFERVEPDLEDVYFSAMGGRIGRRSEEEALATA